MEKAIASVSHLLPSRMSRLTLDSLEGRNGDIYAVVRSYEIRPTRTRISRLLKALDLL